MLKVYNGHIGGVDRVDQNVSNYKIAIRGKKWYARVLTYCVDVALNNAWQLHKLYESKDALDLLTVRRRMTNLYLERFANPPGTAKRGKPRRRADEARL